MQRRQVVAGDWPVSVASRGFTLPEIMIAMSIGSMLMLSAAQIYPLMRQRSQSLGRHYQLDQLLHQTVFTLAKDLRRAGFCNGSCEGKPVITGHADGEPEGSCIIILNDLNRNGRWEKPGTADSEYSVIAYGRAELKSSVDLPIAAVPAGRNCLILLKSVS